MAAVKGVIRTKIDAGTGQPDRAEVGQVKFVTDYYEAAALEAASTISVCFDLPKDAVVIDVILANDALGADSELIVGDAVDPNRYITTVDSSAAAVTHMNAITGMGVLNEVPRNILITTAGAAITGTIYITVLYS